MINGGSNGSTENKKWVEGRKAGGSNVKHENTIAHLFKLLYQADHSSSSKAAVPKKQKL